MKTNIRTWLFAAIAAISTGFLAAPTWANDWYQWRGPEQNGTSREANLPEDWTLDGANQIWSAPYGGMASPIVMRGKVYTISRIGEEPAGSGLQATLNPGPKTQETLVCLDAKTGKLIWQHTSNMYMTDDPFHRIGWSNCCGDPATGRVYGLGAQNELVCLEGDTGKVVWKHQMTEQFGLISTFGGRTPSPAVDEDHLYVAGVAFGWADNAGSAYRIFCFDKSTGDPVWTNATGGIPVDAPYQTPVITNINGEHVLVCGSGDGGTYCFQARTGKKLWGFKGSKRGFNSSVIVSNNRVYSNWDLDNLDSVRLGRIVCLDPSEIKDGSPKEVWRVDGFEGGFPSSTISPDGKTLYAADDKAVIYAVDTETGKIKYRSMGSGIKGAHKLGTIGKASLVLADGKIYFPEANGRMWILKVDDAAKKFEVLNENDVQGKLGREYDLFGSVAISDGHIYFQSANMLYCVGPKEFVAQNVAVPPPPPEPKNGPAVMIQVVPCDISLKSGEKVTFKATYFDAKGRRVGDLKDGKWEIGKLTLPAPRARPKELIRPNAAAAAAGGDTPKIAAPAPATQPAATQPAAPILAGTLKGEVAADGTYTAGTEHMLQGGGVFVSIQGAAGAPGIKGFARVRVFPPLPWKFDFEKDLLGKPPLTWIGAGMKFAVHDLDENGKPNKVLTKLTDIPLFARARTYFGTPDMANYTVEGDVMVVETVFHNGDQVVHKIPNVGLINSRYVLELTCGNQWLGLYAWPAALPRDQRDPGLAIHVAINFPAEAKKWYHMKLMVEPLADETIAYGKVWAKGDAEPKDWMVKLVDKTPNTHGSPGLWGFSNDHEIYYDNLVVTPNGPVAAQAAK